MSGHTVVLVNGERFPLLDDRRFHLGAYFNENTILLDLFYQPPRQVRMSAIDHGVTAAKLQPHARYMAIPPRNSVPAVVLHNLPEAVTPLQLGKFLEACLDGAFIEECNVFCSAVSDAPCNTRAYAVFSVPMHAQMLVEARQIPWPEAETIVYVEPLDMPRPVGPAYRGGRGGRQLADPAVALSQPPRYIPTQQQLQVTRPPVPMQQRYFLQLVEDDEAMLMDWVTHGKFICSVDNAERYAVRLEQGPVQIIFAIRSRKEVFGFGEYQGHYANGDGKTASCGCAWLQYGSAVKQTDIDSIVAADVTSDIEDGKEIRPDWGFDICAAVDRSLGRPAVRAAPPPPPPPPQHGGPMDGPPPPFGATRPPPGRYDDHYGRGGYGGYPGGFGGFRGRGRGGMR